MRKTEIATIIGVFLFSLLLYGCMPQIPGTQSIMPDSASLLYQGNEVVYTNQPGITYQIGCTDSSYTYGTPVWLKYYYLGDKYFDPCGKYVCEGNYVKIQRKGIVSGGQLNYLWYSGAEHPLNTMPNDRFSVFCAKGCVASDNKVYCSQDYYCIPNKLACVGDELQTCSPDGKTITHTPCEYTCRNNACVPLTPSLISFETTAKDSYPFGGDISFLTKVNFDGKPQYNAKVTAKIYKSNQLVSETYGYTDANGWTTITFSGVKSSFNHVLVLSTIVRGVERDYSKTINLGSMCTPLQSSCVDSKVKRTCSVDGTIYNSETCEYSCYLGQCTQAGFNLAFTSDGTYNYGGTLNIKGSLMMTTPELKSIDNAKITGQIIKGTDVFNEVSTYTDSNGEYTMVFSNVQVTGTFTIKTFTDYGGKLITAQKEAYMAGEALKFTIGTFSPIQYNNFPITFEVTVKDSNNRDVYPEKVSNIAVVSTISSGSITTNNHEYLGNGKYRISSDVNGIGLYTGKLEFTFNGDKQSSPRIEIDVETPKILVDTTKFLASSELYSRNNYTISFTSSAGDAIDPEDIVVEISTPSGRVSEKSKLVMSDMVKLGTGKYQFEYLTDQTELYSFNVYGSKEGYTRGSSLASVSVTGEGQTGPGISSGAGIAKWVIIGIVIVIILGFILGRRN
jgi:hypothetical protein